MQFLIDKHKRDPAYEGDGIRIMAVAYPVNMEVVKLLNAGIILVSGTNTECGAQVNMLRVGGPAPTVCAEKARLSGTAWL